MEEQEKSLEAVLGEVEIILEKLQQREVPLEESFSLYEQGVRKLKQCNEKIDRVEKKMLVLGEEDPFRQQED